MASNRPQRPKLRRLPAWKPVQKHYAPEESTASLTGPTAPVAVGACNMDLLYSLAPLDSSRRAIRVLEIQPDATDNSNAVLSVKLRCIELDTTPYTCVSYTWGSDLHLEPILVNGDPFIVYENIWFFLAAMRRKRFFSPLWIDLICIDQGNTLERNHQVHQMADVYRSAQRVFVWLGNSNAAQDELFAVLGAVNDSSRFSASPGADAARNRDDQLQRPDILEDHHWRAFSQLCCNSYWTRLWIVQEIVLAQELTVICGDYILPWHLLLKFCRLVHAADFNRLKFGLRRHVTAELIQNILGLEHGQNRTLGLFEAAARFGNQVCRDLRDHVYGVLGLTDEGADFSVDYEESASDLYMRALEHEAKKRDLCAVGHGAAVNFSNVIRSSLGLEAMATIPWLAVHDIELLKPVANVGLLDFTSGPDNGPSPSVDFWVRDERTMMHPDNESASLYYDDISARNNTSAPSSTQLYIPDMVPCMQCIDQSRHRAAKRDPAVFSRAESSTGRLIYRWTSGPPPRLTGSAWLITRVTVLWNQDGPRMSLDGIASEASPQKFQVIVRRRNQSVPEKAQCIDLWILSACQNSRCCCYCSSLSSIYLPGTSLLVNKGPLRTIAG